MLPADIDIDRLTLPRDFQPFNPRAAFRNYVRSLPHWRQPGASYFLTYRLSDSIPSDALEAVHRERDQWIARIAHERELRGGELTESTSEEYDAFRLRTSRLLEKLMDEGHGHCPLKQAVTRRIVQESLLFHHRERHEMHGFVVMPNHVHLCVKPLGDWQPEDLLQTWKSYTAHEINKRIGRTGQLWQHDTWNRIVRDEGHWHRVMRYIVRNPAKAKVWNGESTVWVDASLLRGTSGVVREEVDEEPW